MEAQLTQTRERTREAKSDSKVNGGVGLITHSGEACLPFARVAFVSGSQLVAMIDIDDKQDLVNVHVGALVKIETNESTVFGIISTLSVPLPAEGPEKKDLMTAEIELMGEVLKDDALRTGFHRGVTLAPQLNSEVLTTTEDDLKLVYARPERETARIGVIHQNHNIPAYIMSNELLGRHFAILGTTGCGKSCAATLILRALVDAHPFAHIVLLDPHNEYAAAFSDVAYVQTTSNLKLPFWMLSFSELLEIITGTGHVPDQAEMAILENGITTVKQQASQSMGWAKRVTVDTPIPYRLNELVSQLDQAMGKIDKATTASPYLRVIARLNALMNDPRYGFMFGSYTVRDNMKQILSSLFRVPAGDKPISIIDLSGVPSEIVNVVVSVLCRLTFDFAMWSERSVPILLVCEESHRYAPKAEQSGFETTKRALSRIAKEGRKYGVSLCLISQRPSEIETGTLSQCSTIFAMRLTNEADQAVLKAIVSESALGFSQSLPSLSNTEAIAVGEGIPVPMRLRFDVLAEDLRPRSETADFSTNWQNDCGEDDFLDNVINRWRRAS